MITVHDLKGSTDLFFALITIIIFTNEFTHKTIYTFFPAYYGEAIRRNYQTMEYVLYCIVLEMYNKKQ